MQLSGACLLHPCGPPEGAGFAPPGEEERRGRGGRFPCARRSRLAEMPGDSTSEDAFVKPKRLLHRPVMATLVQAIDSNGRRPRSTHGFSPSGSPTRVVERTCVKS